MIDIKIKLLDKELTVGEAQELYYALKAIFDNQQITYRPFITTFPSAPMPYTITCTSVDGMSEKNVLD